jgi:hypothetical protein
VIEASGVGMALDGFFAAKERNGYLTEAVS